MDNVLALLFLAAIFGVFKPYIGSLQRRHFAIAAGLLFLAFAAVLPPSEKSAVEAKSADKIKPPKVDKVEVVRAFQASILDGMKPCDIAGSELAKVGEGLANGRTTVYDGYNAAQQTEDACRQSWSALKDLKVPEGLTDAGRQKAEETLELCSNAALVKQMAAGQMSDVFDGDMRPSMVRESQEKAETAQSGLLACVAGIFVVASTEGVDLEKLDKK